MEIKANQFVTTEARRVLTDDGEPGMDGRVGVGSSTEGHQGQVAAAIYTHCAFLDSRQLNELVEWIRLYQD